MNGTDQRSGILAGGNFIVDQLKLIDAWPPQDTLANIVAHSLGNGGSPYNILKNLSRLGARFPLEAVGVVGRDANAAFILEDCRRHGIDVAHLRQTDEAGTSFTDVMTVRDSGRRTFFHQRGANALLGPDDFDFSRSRAKFFHLGYLLLLDALDALGADGRPTSLAVLERAGAAGMVTSVDVVSENGTRFKSTVLPSLPAVDVLFVNDYEAEQITDVAVGRGASLDRGALDKAAARLLGYGVRRLVVIHAPEGAGAWQKDGASHWQPSVRVPAAAIAGTAGAGDALAAGVLLGLHEGWSLAAALELGVCAAASCLSHPSCSDGVTTLGETLARGRALGFR